MRVHEAGGQAGTEWYVLDKMMRRTGWKWYNA